MRHVFGNGFGVTTGCVTVTMNTKGKIMKAKKVKGIVAWIVRTFKPDYHLSKSPAKGVKRKKRVKTSEKEISNLVV